jgi:SAM-dependent methyltransferase
VTGEREPWYVRAFREDYLRVYPGRDLAAARREARELARCGLGEPIVDLGAGFGRHVLAFRELGLKAFGLDLSADLLGAAGSLADGAPLLGRLVRGDLRALPLAAGSAGTLTLLFSSFGYLDDAGDQRILGELRRVLRPGGHAVLDLMNPARVRETLVPRSTRAGAGFELLEERSLEHAGRRVVKLVTLRDARGTHTWREDVRLYQPEELDRMAAAAGLSLEGRQGDFGAAGFDERSPRQIVWLSRDGGERS